MDDQQRKRETELAWLAGIVDGEGSVGFYHRTYGPEKQWSGYMPRSCLGMCCFETICEIVRILRDHQVGHWVSKRGERQNVPNRMVMWRINITGAKRNRQFLPLIIPYMVTKKRKAQTVMGWIESRLSHNKQDPETPEESAMREVCMVWSGKSRAAQRLHARQEESAS